MRETDKNAGSSRTLAVAALLIAAALLLLWFGIGSVGKAPLPVQPAVETEPVVGDSEPVDVPRSERSSPESESVQREKLEAPGPGLDAGRGRALIGRVLDPDGNLVAGAVVALLVLGSKGPDEKLLAHVESGRDGSFALEPLAGMRGRELALIARHDGYRPASIPFRLDAEFQPHDLDLHLERGYSIEGRIVRNGRPVPGASVDVDLRWMVYGVHGIGSEAFWIDGRLEEKIAGTETDASGRFQFSGLGPYQHRLHVVPRGKRGALEHEMQVLAPSTNLEIDITSAEIEITVRRFGMPVGGVWILARTANNRVEVLSQRTQPTHLEFLLGEEVQLSFHDDRSELIEKTVKAPTKGSRSALAVELVPALRPALEIHIPGARAKGIDRLDARIIGESHGIDTARLLSLRPLDEQFLWAAVPLPPGPYRLIIGPRKATSSRYLLESSQKVDLPAVGLLHVEVGLQIGGRFELSFEPAERRSNIVASLHDATGSEVWERTWDRSDFDTKVWSTAIGFGVSAAGHVAPVPRAYRHQHLIDRNLVPGKYRLLVKVHGRKVIDREIVIRAGETTKERVEL